MALKKKKLKKLVLDDRTIDKLFTSMAKELLDLHDALRLMNRGQIKECISDLIKQIRLTSDTCGLHPHDYV